MNFNAYFNLLLRDENELNIFIDQLTVNETYFFRNTPQLLIFSNHVLPQILKEKRKTNDRNIKVWSAGSSNGCEAYTLAILLHENIDNIKEWNIEIIGTDISESVINIAKAGLYTERELKDVPNSLKIKYFTKKEKYYHISDEIKKIVHFDFLNLTKQNEISKMKNVDILFCRNVLIYFDFSVQKKLLQNFYDNLNTDGYIFLGHSESVYRLTKAFRLVRFGKDFAYKK